MPDILYILEENKMKILVTGAAGKLGSNIVENLVKKVPVSDMIACSYGRCSRQSAKNCFEEMTHDFLKIAE